jgi:hypothetical protein
VIEDAEGILQEEGVGWGWMSRRVCVCMCVCVRVCARARARARPGGRCGVRVVIEDAEGILQEEGRRGLRKEGSLY